MSAPKPSVAGTFIPIGEAAQAVVASIRRPLPSKKELTK